jgi:hypothetical protein
VVIIEKLAPASQDPQVNPSATFSSDLDCVLPDDASTFTLLAGGDALGCTQVVPGTYTVTETAAVGAGAQFVSLACDDANSTIDAQTRTATIRVEANETVRCTFVNQVPSGSATADAVSLDDPLPEAPGLSWSMSPAVPGCAFEGSALSCDFGDLAPDATVSIHLTSPTTAQSCGTHENTARARADNRQEVMASATITVRCPPAVGTIVIEKNVTGGDGTFAFTSQTLGPFSIATTAGTGSRSFPDIDPGIYDVAETVPMGWDIIGATCSDGSPIGQIQLAAGEIVTCTFANASRGTATVTKTVGGAAPTGTQSFAFELRQGASTTAAGTLLASGSATAGNGGSISFSPFLVAGATYQLCEVVMPGWATSLGPNPFTLFNAGGDNSTRCADFTVEPGQARVLAIDNTPPPGGLTRTIGFWKNWSSCSKGMQAPVLDRTLARSEPTGIAIGRLTLHGSATRPDVASDCLKAFNLLDKTTIDGKKKSASDPAFNMAAQLLAAKLNIVAGAGSCTAANDAIATGQTLLHAVVFNGLTHTKLTPAQATQTNALATTLDRYNNGLLC